MDSDKSNEPLTILLVDDDRWVLESLLLMLTTHGYKVLTASNGLEAVDMFTVHDVQIVLTDIRMPHMDGIELAGMVHQIDADMPVLIMTAFAEVETAVGALKRGAFDFMIKPINFDILVHSLDRATQFINMKNLEKNYRETLEAEVKQKTAELRDLNREIINRLTVVAEFRDSDTGQHNSRIGLFSRRLARELKIEEEKIELLSLASSLHDIGKVAIPDSILLKPGALTAEEFETIKSHTTVGAKIFEGSNHQVIVMAQSIALHHHERWDGSGYPLGLSGEDIPIEGRIVMLADQYDALRAKRPYKEPLSHEVVCQIIFEGDGRTLPCHFDPKVLEAFRNVMPEIEEIWIRFQDS